MNLWKVMGRKRKDGVTWWAMLDCPEPESDGIEKTLVESNGRTGGIQHAALERHEDGVYLCLWHDKGYSIYRVCDYGLLAAVDSESAMALQDLKRSLAP